MKAAFPAGGASKKDQGQNEKEMVMANIQLYRDDRICRSPELDIVEQMRDSLKGVPSTNDLCSQEIACLRTLLSAILERGRCTQGDCKAVMNSTRIVQAYYTGKTKAASSVVDPFLKAASTLFLWFTVAGDGHKQALILKTRLALAVAATKQFASEAKHYPQLIGAGSLFDVPGAASRLAAKLKAYDRLSDDFVLLLESCARNADARKVYEEVRCVQEETEDLCCMLLCEFNHWREWKDACAQDLEIALQKIIFLVRSMRTLLGKIKLESSCARRFNELGQSMVRCAAEIQKMGQSQSATWTEVTAKIASFAQLFAAQPVEGTITWEFAEGLRREIDEITPAVESLMCLKCEADGLVSKLYQFSGLLFQADCYLNNIEAEHKQREEEKHHRGPGKWDYHLEIPKELLAESAVVLIREPQTGHVRGSLKPSSQLTHYDDVPTLTFELRTLAGDVLDSETLTH